jgi:hypothetical protein
METLSGVIAARLGAFQEGREAVDTDVVSVASRNQVLFRIGAALYLTVVFALALATFLPNDANVSTYLALFVLTLPSSLVAALVSWIVVVFTFGADTSSIFARLLVLTLWMSLATGQMVVIYQLARARQRSV